MHAEKKHLSGWYKRRITILITFIFLTILFYLIYEPILIFIFIGYSMYISKYLRTKFKYASYIKVITIVVAWSIAYLLMIFYLNRYFNSPSVIILLTYFFGIPGVAYIGFNRAEIIMKKSKLDEYYKISIIISASIYLAGIVLLNIFVK